MDDWAVISIIKKRKKQSKPSIDPIIKPLRGKLNASRNRIRFTEGIPPLRSILNTV